MYIQQMHIEVDLAVQKIASNRTRKLLDPEVDWILNKMQGRFVSSKIRPKKLPDGRVTGGFELIQDDLDAIKTLVRSNVKLPCFVGDDRTVYSPLPGDYSYLTQDESVIRRLPPAAAVKQTKQTVYLNVFPVATTKATAPPYYGTVQINMSGNTIFDLSQFVLARQQVWPGFSDPSEVWALHNLLLRGCVDAGYDAYWEYYGDVFYPRSLIIVTGIPASGGSITIDGTTTASTSVSRIVYTKDFPMTPTEYQANRLTASNISAGLLEVAFYGTQPEFPISQVAGRILYVYPNKTFIVTNTVISYVRKPRTMSLILGSDCELSPEYHRQIIDLSTEYIRGIISDPNWEVTLQDNMKRTPLE